MPNSVRVKRGFRTNLPTLPAGELGYTTDTCELWIGTAAGGNILLTTAGRWVRETPAGAIDGSNTVFTLTHTPITGSELVYLNGIFQDVGSGNDYTISGKTITFQAAPLAGDKIRVIYRTVE